MIFFEKQSLHRALKKYTIHYHQEGNHQGKANRLLFPTQCFDPVNYEGDIKCKSRPRGVLKYYYRKAARWQQTGESYKFLCKVFPVIYLG